MSQRLTRSERGFTLMEMMFTVVIVGILAAVALPNYFKAKERGYWRSTEDLLLAIYAGERAYFLVNNAYKAVTASAGMSAWRVINIDDPNLSSIPVAYSVTASGSGATAIFTATAARSSDGSPCGAKTRTVDQNRALTAGTCWASCGC